MSNQAEKRPTGLKIIIGIVLIEGLVLAYLAAQLLVGILVGESRSLPTTLSLFAIVALTAAAVLFFAYGLFQGKRWARSAALFWQLIQLAIASGSFTGQFGSNAIGWGLIIPSVIVLVLLFTKPVVAATMRGLDPEKD
jgi:hypothetical protein